MLRERPNFPVHTIESQSDLDEAPEFLVGPVSTCGPGRFASVPHRHEFTELLYVTSGSGTHLIDGEAFPIHPGRIYLVRRGQVHLWDTDEPLDGTLVLFRDTFLAGEGGPSSKLPIHEAGMLCPDLAQTMRCEALLGAMAEQNTLSDAQSRTVQRHLLSILLLECERITGSRHEGSCGSMARLHRDFETLVASRVSATLTVRDCAFDLGVTPGYLHEVVAGLTGRTPGQVIREAVLGESQRLLGHTDLSCAQIAARVGFEDASYFSSFFRREAGMTPSNFRKGRRPRVR